MNEAFQVGGSLEVTSESPLTARESDDNRVVVFLDRPIKLKWFSNIIIQEEFFNLV